MKILDSRQAVIVLDTCFKGVLESSELKWIPTKNYGVLV